MGIKKVIRYTRIYGVFRTLSKVMGRLRPKVMMWLILRFPFYRRNGARVGVVGCGQHAFSSIAYYLTVSTTAKVTFALDVDHEASSSLAYSYGGVDVGEEYYPEKNGVELPDIVYISSNHATHVDYAIQFIKYGCDVFIEKPIAISDSQLDKLSDAMNDADVNVFAGYNRPYSKSINLIKDSLSDFGGPFSLSCFVTGHYIPDDHWYRDPAEGTRIVANLGHWIDLSFHMLCWSPVLPKYLDILISYTNKNKPSDNICVSMVSSREDLVTLTFTSRSEPFEGVNETINFQQGDVIVKIDDFRETKIWKSDEYRRILHWPKNNGHKSCVLQPFQNTFQRPWHELEMSTRLMLHIEDMVKSKKSKSRFEIDNETNTSEPS